MEPSSTACGDRTADYVVTLRSIRTIFVSMMSSSSSSSIIISSSSSRTASTRGRYDTSSGQLAWSIPSGLVFILFVQLT